MVELHLVPAYGRDYKSKDQLLEAWDANKDFQDSLTNQYVNKEQVKSGKQIQFRYGKLKKTFIHTN